MQQMLAESNKLFSGAMLAEDEYDDPALDKLVGFTPSCLQPWLAASEHVAPFMHGDDLHSCVDTHVLPPFDVS